MHVVLVAFFALILIGVIFASAFRSYRDAYYANLERKLHRRNLRIQNRANGNGGNWLDR